MGLVRAVTPLVKPVRLPTIPDENAVAPLTMEAAKSDPGIFGIENEGFELPPPETAGAGAAIPALPPVDGAE
jgi:hypothetical protein